MKSFRDFINENVFFTGYSKDGRILININGERKTIIVDSIYHNKIRKMERKDAGKAYDFILKLIENGEAYIL
jgi:hypothetical protein